ncbi:hypothetical protein H5V45_08530 [Nocardioides sp. KIGAM211]|uniref:YCII-related domain-containing protein n=1 Tax=Nocardioides luti TaxID=2761101 RepID=A0A7X0RHY4_9ACTN|nr:YciI family protein [Nocardioides luti]MBB6627364.1 hypothetical protein [Nocardioides luti]
MSYFAVTYAYTDDTAARDELRPAHREFLAAQATLALSGPTDDDGALLLFEAGSADEVATLLDEDPFATAGLVAERSVVGWNPVLGPWREQLGLS